VIASIRTYAPDQMYVACDGPNPQREGEQEKVNETRRVIDSEIDWPCDVHRRYSETNQGCKVGVSNAISWFFENVEEGIIIEDDCMPHPSFYPYCAQLLERYRHDTRVWSICGNNFQRGVSRGDGSYFFSRYSLIWGWATWRRCWREYDPDLRAWPAFKASAHLEMLFEDPVEREHWIHIWDWMTGNAPLDTWDFQWLFTCISAGGLSAIPNCNLVENIGFGIDSTHCQGESPDTGLGPGIEELVHPSFVLRNSDADAYTFDTIYQGAKLRLEKQWNFRMRRYIRSLRHRAISLVKRKLT
jgi:hypothetical protein